jgi:hypothetical protein
MSNPETCASGALFNAMRAKRAGDIAGATRLFLDIAWDKSPTIRAKARQELALMGCVVRDDEPVSGMEDLTAGEVA